MKKIMEIIDVMDQGVSSQFINGQWVTIGMKDPVDEMEKVLNEALANSEVEREMYWNKE